MNKHVRGRVAVFRNIQSHSPRYHASPYTVQEQAMREHVRRGYSLHAAANVMLNTKNIVQGM